MNSDKQQKFSGRLKVKNAFWIIDNRWDVGWLIWFIALFTLYLYFSLLRERTDAQFLYKSVTQVLSAEFNNSINEFLIKRLNIGWAFSKSYSKKYNPGKSLETLADGESIHERRFIKKCADALRCINEDCDKATTLIFVLP